VQTLARGILQPVRVDCIDCIACSYTAIARMVRPVSRLGGVVAVDGVLPPELGATEHGCGRLLNFRPHLSAAAEAPVLLLMGQTPGL